METSCFRSLVLSLTIAGVLLSGRVECEAEVGNCNIQALLSKCTSYVLVPGPKIPPSAACCAVVRKIGLHCVCKHLTPEIGSMIDMEKVCYVANRCGRHLNPGTKCGSVTIPPKC